VIILLKKGKYSLIETKGDTKILTLIGLGVYAWVNLQGIGEILITTYKKHKTDQKLAKGEYRLYKVKDDPKLTDTIHLELSVGEGDWQGYLLITGFPENEKTRSRIIPSGELISK
jgi:hypothetical protein